MKNIIYKENDKLNGYRYHLTEAYKDNTTNILYNVLLFLIDRIEVLESDNIKRKYKDEIVGICPDCGCIVLKNKGCTNCSYPHWSENIKDAPNDNLNIDLGFDNINKIIEKKINK